MCSEFCYPDPGNKKQRLLSCKKRTYRDRHNPHGLSSFNIVVEETDLWISAQAYLEREATEIVLDMRHQIKSYIYLHPEFLSSLVPVKPDCHAPDVVKEMIDASTRADVGPMASVAGAIAQGVGRALLGISEEIIVENGGDIFLSTYRPATVSVFAGSSPFSGKLALVIPTRQMPVGVCSSSATVGHSLSMGITDVTCVISKDTALADAAATALGNRVRCLADLAHLGRWADEIGDIIGGVVIVRGHMAAWGDIELSEV